MGILMKAILMRSNLDQDLQRQFGLTGSQIDDCLEQCVALWKKVYFITSILKQQESITDELFQQFDAANAFLVQKIGAFGKTELADGLGLI